MEKLIITAIAILGAFIAIKFKGIFHKIIAFGLTFSVLLVWTGNKYIITSSFIAISILTVTTFIYGLTTKDLNKFDKISITTMGFFLIISSVFKLFHLPGARVIILSMAIPIIITLASFIKGRQLTREMSFMIFWLVYAISVFLRFWTY